MGFVFSVRFLRCFFVVDSGVAVMASEQEKEVKQEEVMMLVTDLEIPKLLDACLKIELAVPDNVQGKKNLLVKLLMQHLFGLDPTVDEQYAVYETLHAHLTADDSRYVEPKVELSEAGIPELLDQNPGRSSTTVEIQKLKDFKISGVIGGTGGKDKLTFTSLNFQISNAKKLGYSESNISGAVIKAIAQSEPLRPYLESRPDLGLSSLLEILRSSFKEKDSASVFTDLSNACQSSAETCIDFVLRLLCLKQKVLDVSAEEGCK